MHVVHQEDAVAEPGQQSAPSSRDRTSATRPGRGALEPLEHARLVALGLQPAEEPRAGVRESLVVEVHRVLRREHDAEAERAGLLEQRQQRRLRGRLRDRREVAGDLVHVEDRAQARRARLRRASTRASGSAAASRRTSAPRRRGARSRRSRCAACPPAVRRSGPISSGSPSSHVAKPGDASRLLRLIASAKRSFAGKNDSRSMTPIRVNGGFWMRAISAARSRSSPFCHAVGQDRRDEDVLAALERIGVDAEQRQQPGRRRGDALAQRSRRRRARRPAAPRTTSGSTPAGPPC